MYRKCDKHLDWYVISLKDAGMTDDEVKRIRGYYYSVSTEKILEGEKEQLKNDKSWANFDRNHLFC